MLCIEKTVWSSSTKSSILIRRHSRALNFPASRRPRRPVSAFKTWALNRLLLKSSLLKRKRMRKESYDQEKQLCPWLLAVGGGPAVAGLSNLGARPRGKEYAGARRGCQEHSHSGKKRKRPEPDAKEQTRKHAGRNVYEL